MGITYNFLKSVWLKKGNYRSRHPLAYCIAAVLLTIPLPNIFNSITTVVVIAYMILLAPKKRARLSLVLALPVALYLLMAASILWSADPPATIKALSKELPLLLFPLCFLVVRKDREVTHTALKLYSYGMAGYSIYYIVRAIFKFTATQDKNVFFYHELVTKEVNAIYISAMASVAFFWFLSLARKKWEVYIAMTLLMLFIILLSSKNIIVTDVIIAVLFYGVYSSLNRKVKIIAIAAVFTLTAAVVFFSKIGDRITAELNPPAKERSMEGINHVTMREAYTLPRFLPNDYFNGTAFRVYQLRIFKEMLQEDQVALRGYGLNASLVRIQEKGVEYNVYQGRNKEEGYHMLNFHNQYIELFADLGVFGFIIFILMQVLNLKNSMRGKDFVHIAFAVLMISLFLTESFLWRQRGVVFFTLLYCLFNANLVGYTKKNI